MPPAARLESLAYELRSSLSGLAQPLQSIGVEARAQDIEIRVALGPQSYDLAVQEGLAGMDLTRQPGKLGEESSDVAQVGALKPEPPTSDEGQGAHSAPLELE
jgi:hypothetical protein